MKHAESSFIKMKGHLFEIKKSYHNYSPLSLSMRSNHCITYANIVHMYFALKIQRALSLQMGLYRGQFCWIIQILQRKVQVLGSRALC